MKTLNQYKNVQFHYNSLTSHAGTMHAIASTSLYTIHYLVPTCVQRCIGGQGDNPGQGLLPIHSTVVIIRQSVSI